MTTDLTKGSITKTMLIFTIPMVLGNLLQQFYNVADTLIVGRFIGTGALAAVGSAYSLMTFLTSVILGLCMGSGVIFSLRYGQRDMERLRNDFFVSFVLIAVLSLLVNFIVVVYQDSIMLTLSIPEDVYGLMSSYLRIIFMGIFFTFIYNYFSCLLRGVGDSLTPLLFLAVAALMNVALDYFLIVVMKMGVEGAAYATVIAQFFSAAGILCFSWVRFKALFPEMKDCYFKLSVLRELSSVSLLTCMQQSIMNFGILMVQGLVNSFGSAVMAAFGAAVKIDSFAYMPVQDFGNAFSTFVAQNKGADRVDRILEGIRKAMVISLVFCVVISFGVYVFADSLMMIFIDKQQWEIIRIGSEYLRIEGMFYCGIGILFLLYGFYRAVGRAGMSVVLTILSLGTRVVLAYVLSGIPFIGVKGIWVSIPIGWLLADFVGLVYYIKKKKVLL